jgi:hypothetical protein
MFEKTRVKAALSKFIVANNCFSGKCLPVFELVLNDFMPYVNGKGFDANQSAVAVITGTLTELRKDPTMWANLKAEEDLYQELSRLWSYCESLHASDPQRWDEAFTGYSNPFTGRASPVSD